MANRSPSISFRYRMLRFESVCQPRLSTVSRGQASSSQPFELAPDGWSVFRVSKGSFTATQKSRLEPRHLVCILRRRRHSGRQSRQPPTVPPNVIHIRAATLKGWRFSGTRRRERTDQVVFLVASSWHSLVSGTPRASRVVWALGREEIGTHFDRAGNS
jgi:hypothetical protein